MVVADNRYSAQDAADAINVDYDVPSRDRSEESRLGRSQDPRRARLERPSTPGPITAIGRRSVSRTERPKSTPRWNGMTQWWSAWRSTSVDPDRHRATLGDGRVQQGLRALHRLQLDSGPPCPGRSLATTFGMKTTASAGHRTRSRWWIRLQTERLQRRDPGRVRRQGARAPGEVDRDPRREAARSTIHGRGWSERPRWSEPRRVNSSGTSSTPSPTWAPTPRTSRSPSRCRPVGSDRASTRCRSPGRWRVSSRTR